MIYFFIALLVLLAIFINYNIGLTIVICLLLVILFFKNKKDINTRKVLILISIFLVFFVRVKIDRIYNYSNLNNTESSFEKIKIINSVDINGNYLRVEGKVNGEKVRVVYNLKNEEEKSYFSKKFNTGIIEADVKIDDIKEKKNFYSFDYKKYNEVNSIYKEVKIKNIYQIYNDNNVFSKINNLRIKLINNITRYSKLDRSGYLQAIIFGDKSNIDKDDINTYKLLGTSHLLAISGLHIATLIGIVYFILKKLSISIQSINRIIFILLPIYMFLVGLQASVLRTGISIMVYLLLRKYGIDKLQALLLTFCLLIFYNPRFIYDIGFQLSFFITFCLIMSSEFLAESNNSLIKGLKISIISSLASFPILLMNFYTFSFISIISNIIFVPFFTIIIFPSILIGYILFLLSENFFNNYYSYFLNLIFYVNGKLEDFFLYFNINFIYGAKSEIIISIIFFLTILILIQLNKKLKKYIVLSTSLLVIFMFITKIYCFNNKYEKINIAGTECYYIRNGSDTLLINAPSQKEQFYNDFRKKTREYGIINQYDLLYNYEGVSSIKYLLLATDKKQKIGCSIDLLATDRVKNLIILEKYKENLKEIINLAIYKKIPIKFVDDNNYNFGTINVKIENDNIIINEKYVVENKG